MPDNKADILAASLLILYCDHQLPWCYYIYIKWFFLNLKGLSDGKAVSLTKKEYGAAVQILQILMKSLKSLSDEWFNTICWSFLLLGIFIIKKCLEFSLTSFGTLKYDC